MKKQKSKKKEDTMNKGEIGIKEMLDYQLDPRESAVDLSISSQTRPQSQITTLKRERSTSCLKFAEYFTHCFVLWLCL